MLDNQDAERMLGKAVLQCWGMLPHDVQEVIFEKAISGDNDGMRSALALRLHQVHPRTERKIVSDASAAPK